MAYVTPTKVDFVKRFPSFARVDDSVIESALLEASRRVDDTWTEEDFALGRMLYAAHVLTLDGHGSGYEAKAAAQGILGFQSISSGGVSVTTRSGASGSSLDTTSFGQRFYELLSRNMGGGIMVANG